MAGHLCLLFLKFFVKIRRRECLLPLRMIYVKINNKKTLTQEDAATPIFNVMSFYLQVCRGLAKVVRDTVFGE